MAPAKSPSLQPPRLQNSRLMTFAVFAKNSGFRRWRRVNCSAVARARSRNTKAGSIKPAASTANILRMLDADPTAFATLTGKKLPPIDSDGSKPFEVTGQHVSALSERKLVNLVRRLLSAEAHKGELPLDGIHVAAVVTAPDGGEDAKIEWTDGPERTKFLPARYTQFQLKASDLSPARRLAGGADRQEGGEANRARCARRRRHLHSRARAVLHQ